MNLTLSEEIEEQIRKECSSVEENHVQQEYDAHMDTFFQICERLVDEVGEDTLCCQHYDDVFKAVEHHNVQMSDIITQKEYDELKRYILNMQIDMPFSIGHVELIKDDDFGGRIRE